MSLIDYIVIAVVTVWIVLAVTYIVKTRKKGGTAGCTGNCGTCMMKKDCGKVKPNGRNNENK